MLNETATMRKPLSIGKADKYGYFTLGWQRLEYLDVLKEDTSVRLEWPESSLFNVRVGAEFPYGEKFLSRREGIHDSN